MKTSRTKTSGIFVGDSLGSGSLAIVRGTVLELQYEGYSSRATAIRSFEQAAEILRAHPEINALMFNVLKQTGHDPGNTALGVRWIGENRGQIRKAVLVTRSQALVSLATIGMVMMPWLEGRVIGTREEALAWCELGPNRADDKQTGPRRASGRGNAA